MKKTKNTKKATKKTEKKTGQLTEFTPRKEPIHSQYGIIPYGLWCKKEIHRINRATGRNTYLKNNEKDEVCIWEDTEEEARIKALEECGE